PRTGERLERLASITTTWQVGFDQPIGYRFTVRTGTDDTVLASSNGPLTESELESRRFRRTGIELLDQLRATGLSSGSYKLKVELLGGNCTVRCPDPSGAPPACVLSAADTVLQSR